MVWTALWMVGLCLMVGAIAFDIGGPEPAAWAVGATMAVEGVFADLAGRRD